jgi:hypothetical protein
MLRNNNVLFFRMRANTNELLPRTSEDKFDAMPYAGLLATSRSNRLVVALLVTLNALVVCMMLEWRWMRTEPNAAPDWPLHASGFRGSPCLNHGPVAFKTDPAFRNPRVTVNATRPLWIKSATVHDGLGGVFRNHDVLVRDGIIVKLGARADVALVAASLDNVVEIDAAGRVLTPGIVDMHRYRGRIGVNIYRR